MHHYCLAPLHAVLNGMSRASLPEEVLPDQIVEDREELCSKGIWRDSRHGKNEYRIDRRDSESVAEHAKMQGCHRKSLKCWEGS